MNQPDAPQASSSYVETHELTVGEEKPTVAKAVIAGVIALSGQLTTALVDGTVTAIEWVSVGAYTVLAVAGVWAVSNKRS